LMVTQRGKCHFTIWLLVWNIFLFFHIIIRNNHPNWLIFFRSVETTNQLFKKEDFDTNGS
jgi:hypothetical protein